MPPFDGSGTYAAPANSWNPAVTNTTINSTDWAALLADLTTALSTCLLKDGTQTPTAAIPMGGFRLTGLGAATTNGDAVRYQQTLAGLAAAKGDILVATAANAVAKQAVGADGKGLVADSAQTNGIKYQWGSFLSKSGTGVSTPNDTNEDTLVTFTLKANALGANGCLRFKLNLTMTNNANAKTIRVKFGSTVMASSSLANLGTQQLMGEIFNAGATNSQVINFFTVSTGNAVANNSAGSANVDTTADVTVTITGQKANGTDTLQLNNYLFEIFGDGT